MKRWNERLYFFACTSRVEMASFDHVVVVNPKTDDIVMYGLDRWSYYSAHQSGL